MDFGAFRLSRFLHAAAFTLAALALPAQAADYPARPITVIVSFPAGGLADVHMRATARLAEKALGQPIIIENKPGALGTLGASAAARAKPDGYTLFQVTQNVFRAPYLMKASYQTDRDFQYIVGLADADYVIAVRADSPYKTLQAWLTAARAEPGKLSFGSTGVGGTGHLCMEDLSGKAGVKLLHVPYKGAPEQIQGLYAGGIDAMTVPFSEAAKQGDRVRILAVFSEKRPTENPAIPTAIEAGYRVVMTSYIGIAGPRGIDAAIVRKLQDAFQQAALTPEYQQLTRSLGLVASYKSAEDYAKWASEAGKQERLLVEKANLAAKD